VKPHKGNIHLWKKLPLTEDQIARCHEIYKESPGLGYLITGWPDGHPRFSNWIRTSWVVKHEGNEIETRNSRYTLVGDEVP